MNFLKNTEKKNEKHNGGLDSITERKDTHSQGKRVELHLHTKMSAMDGLIAPKTAVRKAAGWGQKAIAITDHGVVHAFPAAYEEAKRQKESGNDIKVIFGIEGYMFDDSKCINNDGSMDYKAGVLYHVILLAKNQLGLENIYKLVSLSHLNYFYRKPRLPKSLIESHREGIIVGSTCKAGEVFRAVLRKDPLEVQEKIASFYDYLEIQPISNNRFLIEHGEVGDDEGLRNLNRQIVELGDKLGKPVVATSDAHYENPESKICRDIILSGQGYENIDTDYGMYMRTTDEMLEEFSFLGEEKARQTVIDNTNMIADMIEEVHPLPQERIIPVINGAEETLRRSCMEGAQKNYGNPLPHEISERLEKELDYLRKYGNSYIFVSAQNLIKKILEDGYPISTRGAVGSSLAAFMAGVTDINPLEPHYLCPNCKHIEWGNKELYDCGRDMPQKKCPECGNLMNQDGYTIPFATFFGIDGERDPDIDIKIEGEYLPYALKHLNDIFGKENIYKSGTVETITDRRAASLVTKYEKNKGIKFGSDERKELIRGIAGVKINTGQIPGKYLIVPEGHEISEFTPVQHPYNYTDYDEVSTHFDYNHLSQNIFALNILCNDALSMLKILKEMTGIGSDDVSFTDKKVIDLFSSSRELGIEPGYSAIDHGYAGIPGFSELNMRRVLREVKPKSFADLVRVYGLAHGTDAWQGNAQYYMKKGVAAISDVISTRDDIMNYLVRKGVDERTAFGIMDCVRRNRPLRLEQINVMCEQGVPSWYIESCIRIMYLFPRAHAVSFTMTAYRAAWYKLYYPKEFYAAYFKIQGGDVDMETIKGGPKAVIKRIEEIEHKKHPGSKELYEKSALEVAYEMMARGYGFQSIETMSVGIIECQ